MDLHAALQTPYDVKRGLADRARARRLLLNMSQAELAERTGVSLSSVRRFEATGDISLHALLDLAFILGELQAFTRLFPAEEQQSLFARKPSRPRQRSRKKTAGKGTL